MSASNYQELSINLVELDMDNPRIKMYLENYTEITAEGIALALNTSSNDGNTSFSSLRESIKVNGGIINPILVNHRSNGSYVVIEGNTRLQIYKDFSSSDVPGNWDVIRCIVYENLSEEEIHSIRLQSHLVGPREWDPYSKAKYLDFLMNKEKLPLASIISFCGGKKTEINRLVTAYRDMQQYYIPIVKEMGYDLDYKDFSKFAELQNKSILDSLIFHGYTKVDYAKWVINGNIDTAQNVRLLPSVLKNPISRAEFIRTNISNAYGKINISTTNIDLNSVDYIDLCRALTNKLDRIELRESKFLNTPEGLDKRNALLNLIESAKFVLDDTEDD